MLGWWRAVRGEGSTLAYLPFGFALVGALVGLGSAIVAFEYHGNYPLNVLLLMVALVIVPNILLLLSIVASAGGRTTRSLVSRFPVLRRLESRWQRWSVETADVERVFRWQVLAWSQFAAIGFFLLVVLVFLTRVAFSDLAFGWSTTLEIDAVVVSGWVEAWSRPWAALLPIAVPDADLVSASQYFRIEDDIDVDARALGAWWPFVLTSFVVYGAGPRVVVLLIALVRLDRLSRRILIRSALVQELLQRLESSVVANAASTKPRPFKKHLQSKVTLVRWNALDAGTDWLKQTLGVEAGGEFGLGPADAFDAIPMDRDVVVAAKAWEPPLLEFTDSLRDLIDHLDVGTLVMVVLVGVDGEIHRDDEVWRRVLDSAGLEDVALA